MWFKKAIHGCLLLAAVTGIYACSHTADDIQPAPDNGNGGGNDTALCFERDILPIFIANCARAGCHDAASHQDGYVFTSYQTITARKFTPGQPALTELYEKITEDKAGKIMPPPPAAPLTSQQIGLIYRWIAIGAPNTTGCTSGCDSSNFTFSEAVLPMLNQNCRGCHSGTAPSGGVNLERYEGVLAVANDGRLLGAVKQLPGYQAMPQGSTRLSPCRITQIEKWVAAGAPNN